MIWASNFCLLFRNKTIKFILPLLFIIPACASKQPLLQNDLSGVTDSPLSLETSSTEMGWWRAAIRIKSGDETVDNEDEIATLWHVDVFLAHSIMAPVIRNHKKDIELWRFHRRATPDATGHQFSFAFYSTAETANIIFQEIDSSTLMDKARRNGVITKQIYDDTNILTSPAISDTSDDDWSTITQKAWPYYIMGVSQMWLKMIDDIVKDNPPNAEEITSLSDLINYYEEVNEVVTSLWRDEAQHAFLHHLNAIFGYEPMVYFEPRLIRF